MKLIRTHSDIGLRVLAGLGQAPTMKVGLELSELKPKTFFETSAFIGIAGAVLGVVALGLVKKETGRIDRSLHYLNERIYEVEEKAGLPGPFDHNHEEPSENAETE